MLNNTMRIFLRVHKSTPTCMIKGELGIKDISEYVDNRILNHWCNIATGEYKISSILYQWVKKLYDQNIFKSKWLDKVKCTLDHTGMSNIFHNISDVNKQWFKNTVKLRLNDIHNQKWSESVFNNSVCLNYRVMTTQKKLQTYIITCPSQFKYALCKLKCSNHRMPIVTGRYAGIPVDEPICTLLQINEIGDEYHYLLICPHFSELRSKYIKKYYYTHPNMFKLEKLFNESNSKEMLNISKFAYHILQEFKHS